jgi:hypothetical protein
MERNRPAAAAGWLNLALKHQPEPALPARVKKAARLFLQLA